MNRAKRAALAAAAVCLASELSIPEGLTKEERIGALKNAAALLADKRNRAEMGGHRNLYRSFWCAYLLLIYANALTRKEREAFLQGLPGESARSSSHLALQIVRGLNRITAQAASTERATALKRFSAYAGRLRDALAAGYEPEKLLFDLESRKFSIATTPGTRPLVPSPLHESAALNAEREGEEDPNPEDADTGHSGADSVQTAEDELDACEDASPRLLPTGRYLQLIDRDGAGVEDVIFAAEIKGRLPSGPALRGAFFQIKTTAAAALRTARMKDKTRRAAATKGGKANG